MLKQVVAFAMLLTVMVQTYSKAFIVLDYHVNTAAFAEHCENKARPEMHCNGKCQMMKQLKKEDNKDNQNPDRKAAANEVISSKSFFSDIPSPLTLDEPASYFVANDTKVKEMPRKLFHPPGA